MTTITLDTKPAISVSIPMHNDAHLIVHIESDSVLADKYCVCTVRDAIGITYEGQPSYHSTYYDVAFDVSIPYGTRMVINVSVRDALGNQADGVAVFNDPMLVGGVDTEEERDIIEYQPLLDYTKPTVLAREWAFGSYESDALLLAVTHTPALAIKRLRGISTGYADLLYELDGRLAADVVEFDTTEDQDVCSAIKAYCSLNQNPEGIIYNDDKINFSMYKKALAEQDHSDVAAKIVTAYEGAHAKPDGRVEVDAYRMVRESQHYWDLMAGTLETALGAVSPSQASIRQEREQERQERLDAWQELERQKTELQAELDRIKRESGPASPELEPIKNQIADIDTEIARLRNSADITIGIVGNEIANTAENNLRSLSDVIHKTVNDNLNGMTCCLVKKLLYGTLAHELGAGGVVGQDIVAILSQSLSRTGPTSADPDAATVGGLGLQQDVLAKAMKSATTTLHLTRLVLDYMIYGVDIDRRAILGSLMQLVSQPISAVQAQVINGYAQLKNATIQPLLSWLQTLARDGDTTCLPFEELGANMVKYINNIDSEFRKGMLNMFKLNTNIGSTQNKTIDTMKNKEKLRALRKAVTVVIDFLDEVARLGCLDKVEIGNPDVLAKGLIKKHALDYTYNTLSGNVQKLDSMVCDKELANEQN